MNKTIFSMVILSMFILVSACGIRYHTTHTGDPTLANLNLKNWLGVSRDRVIVDLGPPDRVFHTSDGTDVYYYTWTKQQEKGILGFTTTDKQCYCISLWIKNDKVVDYRDKDKCKCHAASQPEPSRNLLRWNSIRNF